MQGIRSERVPEELWMEVRDIVQEAGIKTILKKCKKAKLRSEEEVGGGLRRSAAAAKSLQSCPTSV